MPDPCPMLATPALLGPCTMTMVEALYAKQLVNSESFLFRTLLVKIIYPTCILKVLPHS